MNRAAATPVQQLQVQSFLAGQGKSAAVKNAPALLPIMVHSVNHLNTNANLNMLKREMLFKINEFPVKDKTFKSKQSKKSGPESEARNT